MRTQKLLRQLVALEQEIELLTDLIANARTDYEIYELKTQRELTYMNMQDVQDELTNTKLKEEK
jgi:hypothetical protein